MAKKKAAIAEAKAKKEEAEKEKSMMMDQQADTSMLGPGEVSMMAQEEGKMD